MKKLIYKNDSFLTIVDGFVPDNLYPEPEHLIWYIPDWFADHCFVRLAPDYSADYSVPMMSNSEYTLDQTLQSTVSKFVDPRPLANEMALSSIKARRAKLLADCDWTAVGDVALSVEKKNEWIVYRQALRDLPNKFENNPNDVNWPIPPSK